MLLTGAGLLIVDADHIANLFGWFVAEKPRS